MRRTRILMTALLAWRPRLGRRAGGPPDDGRSRDLQRALRRRRMPPAPCRARLKFASIATRRTSIARPWRRRSAWVVTRGFVTTIRNAPEVGQLVLGGGQPYAIRYARERVEGGGRTIVVVTDRPVFFLGGGRETSKPRAGYEVAVVQIQLDAKGTGQGDDRDGCRARAPRWRRRCVA